MEQLLEKIQSGSVAEDEDFVTNLQQFSVQDLNRGIHGLSAITCAVLSQNLSALHALISRGCNVNVTSEVYDDIKRLTRFETPLITAARLGLIEIVRILLGNNASLDIPDQTIGKSALHWACARGHNTVALLLLSKGARADQLDYYCETPIVEAIGSKDMDLVKALVKYGADINRPLNYDHDSALTLSLMFNASSIAKYLIQAGSSVYMINKDGDDPLTISLSMKVNKDDINHIVTMLLYSLCKIKPCHFNKLSILQPPEFYLHIKHLLIYAQTIPLSLTCQCRILLRRQIQSIHTCRDMLDKISMLPCPKRVHQFLSFEIL